MGAKIRFLIENGEWRSENKMVRFFNKSSDIILFTLIGKKDII